MFLLSLEISVSLVLVLSVFVYWVLLLGSSLLFDDSLEICGSQLSYFALFPT